MEIVWLERAVLNLEMLREYIGRDNTVAARKIALHIIKEIEQLQRFPNLGRPGRVAGTRELAIADTPYLVPYRVHYNVVEILCVLHTAQQWPKDSVL